MPSRMSSDDPFAQALAPPVDETPDQRSRRLQAEAEAKKVSDMIDDELNRERSALKKSKPIKVLLLGQSESGKSTTLKNFQLMNSPKAFREERVLWRAIIQLNVVRSIRIILDAMEEATSSRPASPNSFDTSNPQRYDPAEPVPTLTPDHMKLRLRLLPVLGVEEALLFKLAAPQDREFEAIRLKPLTNHEGRRKELAVNSNSTWKGAFNRLVKPNGRSSDEGVDWDDPEDPGRIITACGQDMMTLWKDPTVRQLLRSQRLRLEEMPGFFLDDLARITGHRYMPTDDDILRARLKTLGVTEYKFNMLGSDVGKTVSGEWRVYDVGGQRSMRSAWVPFFDDMDAIIFLAPISCFDQVLAEDQSVNRLEDSVLLWKSIVSNKLLAKTNIILFLNKCDVLHAKLNAGIQLANYIISYGDRANDFETASLYLQRKFAQIMKDHSTRPRQFYSFLTSVTDTKATAMILSSVQDTVLRQNLQGISLI